LLPVLCVDDRDPAAAKSDINPSRRVLVTNIVSIILEVQFTNLLERFSVVDFENPSLVIRNKEAIEFGHINDSLRCANAADRANSLAFTQIQYLDSVVAKCADK